MVNAMNNVEEKTNSLQMALVQNLNRVRTKDQVLALLDLYQVSKNNFNRTEKLLTETLGALGTDEVVPILTQISRDTNVNLGIRNRALEILGKKLNMSWSMAATSIIQTSSFEITNISFGLMSTCNKAKSLARSLDITFAGLISP